MLSDEEKEILNNIKEYMQNDIDKGYHKFVYNDLGSDFKCIDCINAIDKVLKQSKEMEEYKKQLDLDNECEIALNSKVMDLEKEIEELKNGQIDFWISDKEIEERIRNKFISKDKIKAKIEEYDDKGMTVNLVNRSVGKTFQQAVHYEVKKVLQSLLEKE